MNSCHSFSPSGRWLVFSSKSRSPYTQVYLTRIDSEGNDGPPILIDNTTAANRAANIPEFVNVTPGGLRQIGGPVIDYYRLLNRAVYPERIFRRADCAKHGRIRQMARTRFHGRCAPVVLILGALCGGLAYGAVAPNPGGTVVTTNSTSATIGYVDTPVTQRVDLYSTTVVALQNGSQVFSQSFSVPFTDAAVQAAIVQANGILSGRGATFGAPALTTNTSVLQSSVITPPPTSTCLSPGTNTVTGATTVTTVDTFGPATVAVGDCQSDTFTVLSGQLDININTDIVFAVPRNVVTTNTFLTTQTYLITGTGGTAAVAGAPALSGWGMAGLALLLAGAGTLLQRRSSSRQSG
jgi:hypothetical protein